jgi:N-acetylglutamate synthase-like GNAT family acetyltransferase
VGYRIEASDPTEERAQVALNAFLSEMAERVDARFLDADVVAQASKPEFFVLALDDADRAVGCAALRQVSPGVGEIGQMWVNQVLRGRGIGRRMLSALEGAAAVAELNTVRLETHENLSESILLFETNGYQRVSESDNEVATHIYEKQLD